jgi:hypothetical protein
MSGKSIFCFLFSVLILFYASCGGPPSYTAPIVTSGNVVQSECTVPEKGDLLEEKVEVRSVEGEIVIVHSNILLPENTLVGIIDIDGYVTYERMTGYYYLEAGDQFINVREKFKLSSSPDNCFYDMTIRISNVSGGTYHLTLFGNDGIKIHSSEVRVR